MSYVQFKPVGGYRSDYYLIDEDEGGSPFSDTFNTSAPGDYDWMLGRRSDGMYPIAGRYRAKVAAVAGWSSSASPGFYIKLVDHTQTDVNPYLTIAQTNMSQGVWYYRDDPGIFTLTPLQANNLHIRVTQVPGCAINLGAVYVELERLTDGLAMVV